MTETMYLGMAYLGAAVGAGLTVIGVGVGIGKLAASTVEGIARQPEAVGDLRTTMIIAAALIEGLAFFSLIICLLTMMNFSKPEMPAPQAPQAQTQTVAH